MNPWDINRTWAENHALALLRQLPNQHEALSEKNVEFLAGYFAEFRKAWELHRPRKMSRVMPKRERREPQRSTCDGSK